MWRMMDNSLVLWLRQRFPLIALKYQNKWQQKVLPEFQDRGRALGRFSHNKETRKGPKLEKCMKLSATVVPHFCWLDRWQFYSFQRNESEVLKMWAAGLKGLSITTVGSVLLEQKEAEAEGVLAEQILAG